ncbi:MAG: type II toxin-antitoxin system RelE/ParE family toxin [Thermoproteales archaeon]|nr:type II toxin-antitoxin system RelE/ParE family toxin [Thermoproteales archaeon]
MSLFLDLHLTGDLRNIDSSMRNRIIGKLNELKKDPSIGRPLKPPFKGLWRLRVSKYRTVYYLEPCHIILLSR